MDFRQPARAVSLVACLSLLACASGCSSKAPDKSAEAPPPASVQTDANPDMVEVKNPQAFPLFSAVSYQAPSTLQVTGSVNPGRVPHHPRNLHRVRPRTRHPRAHR